MAAAAFPASGAFCRAGDTDTAKTVTIDECYARARENYPAIRRKGLIELTRNYDLSNASRANIPQVSISGKATYQSDVTTLPFDVPGIDTPSLSRDQYQITADISQNIWDGGITHAQKKTVRGEAEVSALQLETQLYEIRSRVNQMYFGILLQKEMLAQNATLQKDLAENVRRIEAMMENGTANRTDLDAMSVELISARQREDEIKSSIKAYISMLGIMTGMQIDESTAFEIPESSALKLSGEVRRTELQMYGAQERLLDTRYKAASSVVKPRLSLFAQGGYGRPGLNMLDNDFSAFAIAGVRLKWDISGFYTLGNNRRKIDAQRMGIQADRDTFLQNLSVQMSSQMQEINKYETLLETDNRIISLRASIRRAAEKRFENGVISVTDLIREINAEDMARQSFNAHRINFIRAVYDYKYITNN